MRVEKLSIRLLREGVKPEDAVRENVTLQDWDTIDGAKIATGTVGGRPPKWVDFLELEPERAQALENISPYGVVFVHTSNRWFAVSFGMGHAKLDPAKCEQDFGLRVVLNSVDPKQLRSADIRTPDENTLSRRAQTSRGSDPTAFSIDVERDIVRGLAGTPRDTGFASRVSGADALCIHRRLAVRELTQVCDQAYALFQRTDYRQDFSWIDDIRHIRDSSLIGRLDNALVEAMNQALAGNVDDRLHLAYPYVFDPDQLNNIKYRGFGAQDIFPDLELADYLHAMRSRGIISFTLENLSKHTVQEVDDEGKPRGQRLRIRDFICFETVVEDETYVLSGGRWYRISQELAAEVTQFFDRIPRYPMPDANPGETEEDYYARISQQPSLLGMDSKLVRPSRAHSSVEFCDLLSTERHLIHVKDKNSSSRLSHLFNQGTVSARLLVTDAQFRDRVRAAIREAENHTGKQGYQELIPASDEQMKPGQFTVVYAVLTTSQRLRLPFFSLITFRQAVRELRAMGFETAFAWIRKPAHA